MPSQQYAVEHVGGGNEILTRTRRWNGVCQRIDHRVFNAGIIAAALLVSGGRTPEKYLLISWRERIDPFRGSHVIIE